LIASSAKYPGAAENLETTSNRLNAAEIRDARSLAAAFKPKPTTPDS